MHKVRCAPADDFIHTLGYSNLAENLMVTGYGKQS
jgi:hypothetical protein